MHSVIRFLSYANTVNSFHIFLYQKQRIHLMMQRRIHILPKHSKEDEILLSFQGYLIYICVRFPISSSLTAVDSNMGLRFGLPLMFMK